MSDIDILNEIASIDLSKVETSFPIPASGAVHSRITKCNWETAEGKKGLVTFLDVEFTFEQDWHTQAMDGQPSRPLPVGSRGSKISKRIYVGKYTDKKDGTEKMYGLEEIARLREAALGKAAEGTRFNPTELISQSVVIVLTFDPAPKNKDTGETYGPRTEVTRYVRKSS